MAQPPTYAYYDFDTLTPAELRTLRHTSDPHLWTGGVVGEKHIPTQESFARRLGIAPNTLARLERGELPIRASLARLALYVTAECAEQEIDAVRHRLGQARAAAQQSTVKPPPRRFKAKPAPKKGSLRHADRR